ncbi:sensor histidine kinase [Jeotgalibacillus salarius]|uniref:histidine kinase n=1 Tax=Jeotgalibacillus salarius TaxID=546023 RepID=A0A4Y8LHP8_9BACL|nr:HAMP domain-containing sensor histidine kinase [Jeotgalibacillus salarius]TFE02356.1 HAMP domain-containing histidine kinase [Jeotgalibacillus salarius]
MNRLSLKISLFYLSGLAIILTISLFVMHNHLVNQQVENELERLQQRGDSHRDVLADNFDMRTISHVVLMEEKALTEVVIIAENGSLAGASNQADNHINEDWLTASEGTAEDDWRNQPFLVSISPIDGGGSVIMLEPTEQIQALIRELNQHFAIAALLTGLFLLFSLYFLSHFITKPLLSIRKAAGKLSQGDILTVPETKRQDEIGELARSITKISGDLHQIQKTRKAFLTSIAHELRTPITYIKGYAGLLKKEDSPYGQIIYEETDRLHQLIEDLFELARMEEQNFTIEPERTEITSFVRSVTERMQLAFDEQNIRLLFQADSAFYKEIDQNRFEQVLIIILDNALKYTPADQKVLVSVSNEKIEVTDEGPGVPEDALPQLFDRFYRVDTSRNRDTGGTGLGLSIAKEMIEAHHGKISAENTGSGLKMIIDLKGVHHEENRTRR